MVPTPRVSAIEQLLQFDRSTLKVSLGSTVVSPFTVTIIVCDVWLTENDTVPVVDT